jgi:hypothetical protein
MNISDECMLYSPFCKQSRNVREAVSGGGHVSLLQILQKLKCWFPEFITFASNQITFSFYELLCILFVALLAQNKQVLWNYAKYRETLFNVSWFKVFICFNIQFQWSQYKIFPSLMLKSSVPQMNLKWEFYVYAAVSIPKYHFNSLL